MEKFEFQSEKGRAGEKIPAGNSLKKKAKLALAGLAFLGNIGSNDAVAQEKKDALPKEDGKEQVDSIFENDVATIDSVKTFLNDYLINGEFENHYDMGRGILHNIKRANAEVEYYDANGDGSKKFDVRIADFDIHEGDSLILEEWDPDTKSYTGRKL